MASVSNIIEISAKEAIMIQSVLTTSRAVYDYACEHAPSRNQLTKNIATVALPTIALAITANLPTANAASYIECINSCDRWETESKFICHLLCLLFAHEN